MDVGLLVPFSQGFGVDSEALRCFFAGGVEGFVGVVFLGVGE